jgi:NADH:ubiquinone oxidoreductase subunit E
MARVADLRWDARGNQGPEHFPDELRERAKEIIARYPADRSRSALLPLLHLVQSHEGYVSPDGIGFCAEQLGLTRAEVGAGGHLLHHVQAPADR